MLGARGVRLGILKPSLYRAQIDAIVQAVEVRLADGGTPIVEVMIPLVSDAAELALVRRWMDDQVRELRAAGVSFAFGAMIETPRAALLAGELAAYADFFSIGTNDLTQLVYGFSRDDVERRCSGSTSSTASSASARSRRSIAGVGELIRHAIVEAGLAGPGSALPWREHGGDPPPSSTSSEVGVDAVSCSPFGCPSPVSAAQAVLRADVTADNPLVPRVTSARTCVRSRW
jgi:pyruvate,orthophosphate dikinase